MAVYTGYSVAVSSSHIYIQICVNFSSSNEFEIIESRTNFLYQKSICRLRNDFFENVL